VRLSPLSFPPPHPPGASVFLTDRKRYAAFLGDTFHLTSHPTEPLESFKPLKSMVFAGIYPLDPGGFGRLEEAIRRVRSRCFFLLHPLFCYLAEIRFSTSFHPFATD
jgi:hypothetical protein